MSRCNPQCELENWLLPYKPIDTKEATPVVLKKHNLNAKKVGDKQNELRDSKNRRILSKQSLLEDRNVVDLPEDVTGLKDVPSSASAPSFSSIPTSMTMPGPSTNYGGFLSESLTSNPGPMLKKKEIEKLNKQRESNMTPLQRNLKKALATPASFTKAESMMLKMGWSGGALGKTGGGITEPIVPNLTYATTNKGFGQEPPPITAKRDRKKPAKKQPDVHKEFIKLNKRKQRMRLKMAFRENILISILEFVRNEREIGILFDKSLHNGQRKIIHCIVEEIRELGKLGDKGKRDMNNSSYDRLIMFNIVSKNRYALMTQSEGQPPDRFLCLYKEAPESMYLITHYKLNDKETDYVKREETILNPRMKYRKKKKNPLRGIDKSHDSTTCAVADNDKKSGNEKYCYSDTELDSESIIETANADFNDNDDEMKDIDDDAMNDFNEQIDKTLNIDEKIEKIVERTTAGGCTIIKNYIHDTGPDIADKPFGNEDIQSSGSLVEKSNKNIVKCEEIEPKDIERQDESKIEETQHNTDNNDSTPVTISILACSRKEFMRYNLNMCFSDFLAGSGFKEFKFLGEFDEEEFEVLNEFLKDFFLVIKGEPAVNTEFMDVWNQGKCKLSFSKDMNGGIVIYKVI